MGEIPNDEVFDGAYYFYLRHRNWNKCAIVLGLSYPVDRIPRVEKYLNLLYRRKKRGNLFKNYSAKLMFQ